MDDDILKQPLPPDWSFGVMQDGRIFFINDRTKTTSWLHPDIGEAVRSGHQRSSDLPPGWEESFTDQGSYYVDHNTCTTSFEFPKTIPRKKMDSEKLNALKGTPEDSAEFSSKKKKRKGSFKALSPSKGLFRRSSSKAKSFKDKENRESKSKSRPVSARSAQSRSVRTKLNVRSRNPAADVTKSGWLYKQDSTGKMKMWRKRWFVLVDFCLYYYKDPKEDDILGSIVLPSYTVDAVTQQDKINRKYAFRVEHSGMRKYYFSAESYNDMAEWITALRKCCVPASPEKSVKANSRDQDQTDSKKSSVKKKDSVKEVEDDSEFGFNKYKPASVSSTSSSSVFREKQHDSPIISNYIPPANENKLRNENNSNGVRSVREIPMKKAKENHYVTANNMNNTNRVQQPPPQYRQQQQPQQHRQPQQKQQQKQQPIRDERPYENQPLQQRSAPQKQEIRYRDQKPVKRDNGESAYYSDTSGATENSRNFTNRDYVNQQSPRKSDSNNEHIGSPTKSTVKRQNSLAKLNEWAQNRAEKQQQKPSSPRRQVPNNHYHKGRRYKAHTYNEYMDSMEVASSIMSMPPVKQSHRTRTLPRPQSSEDLNRLKPVSERQLQAPLNPSKSAGNIMKDYPTTRSTRPTEMKRSKSDYVRDQPDSTTTSPRSRRHGPMTPRSGVTSNGGTPRYDDVFSPASSKSPHSAQNKQKFRYDNEMKLAVRMATNSQPQYSTRKEVTETKIYYGDQIDAAPTRQNRMKNPLKYAKKDSPLTSKRIDVPPTNAAPPKQTVEVKQIDVKGNKGQLRAFAISRSPMKQSQVPNHNHQPTVSTKPAVDGREVEGKLKHLEYLEQTVQQVLKEIDQLQSDKEKIEDALLIASSRLESHWNSSNHESSRELTREQRELERDLKRVKSQLSNVAQKLKRMTLENENFEKDIKDLKRKLIVELEHQKQGPRKDLEWELGRIQYMIEGVDKNKKMIMEGYEMLQDRKQDDDNILSPTSPSSILSSSSRSETRSPRDVKRTSNDRRNPRSSSEGKKFNTLPGRGVSHATSVDSLTAATLTRGSKSSTSPRPLSARSYTNIIGGPTTLTRTKSATERLFRGSQPNISSDKEADDIKKLQREINRNRVKSLNTAPSQRKQTYRSTLNQPRIGMDVKQAMKHHKMPKVLQRANRDQARAETEKQFKTLNYTDEDGSLSYREADLEPVEPVNIDLNHELLAPDKVHIPERLIEIEFDDTGLSPRQMEAKENKVKSIERILARSGQQASMAAVHLAAALSVEAGSAARAVAYQAMENEAKSPKQDPDYESAFIV